MLSHLQIYSPQILFFIAQRTETLKILSLNPSPLKYINP